MKTRIAITAIVGIFAIVGCQNATFDDPLRKEVRKNLKDPDSAKWGEKIIVKNMACLVVNAKNTYGGYTGDQTAWLENLNKTGGENWYLHGIDEKPCYESALKDRVSKHEATAAFESKVANILKTKNLYKVSDNKVPLVSPNDANADKCLSLANRIMTSYRIAQDEESESDRAKWMGRAEQQLGILESGRCEWPSR